MGHAGPVSMPIREMAAPWLVAAEKVTDLRVNRVRVTLMVGLDCVSAILHDLRVG